MRHIDNSLYTHLAMQRLSDTLLNDTFSALADPTRRAILARLAKGEATVTELAVPFKLSQPTISRHLKVLTDAGLITRRREAQFHHCQLNAERLQNAWGWLGGYSEFWEQSLDRLDSYAKHLHAEEKHRGRTPKKR